MGRSGPHFQDRGLTHVGSVKGGDRLPRPFTYIQRESAFRLGIKSGTGSGIAQLRRTSHRGNRSERQHYLVLPYLGIPAKQLSNSHFLVNPGLDLQEVDLTCNTVRDVSRAQVNQSLQANGYDFTIPPQLGLAGGNPFHHDMLALPNGHWIALCQIAKDFDNLDGVPGTTQVVGDAIVDIDPNGNVVWAWSSFDHLDVSRHPYFGLPDWTHSNALVYTADGNLLLSIRAQSWIIKIDYANGTGTGNIQWKLGAQGDFSLYTEENGQAVAQNDPSLWFYSQHYPHLLSSNGSVMQLLVYDNGNFRTYSDGSVCGTPVPGCFSRATIFEVDESTRRATLVWQDLPGLFSLWGGSIEA